MSYLLSWMKTTVMAIVPTMAMRLPMTNTPHQPQNKKTKPSTSAMLPTGPICLVSRMAAHYSRTAAPVAQTEG